jgi:type III secretory pathway component EscU
MVLEEVQVAAIGGCANQGCVALVVGASVVTAASVVISGTIVVTGNIAYWFERKTSCQKLP